MISPTDPAAYAWPEPCRASLLAQLRATSAADEAERWARLLPVGSDLCDFPMCTAPIINGVPLCHHSQASDGVAS